MRVIAMVLGEIRLVVDGSPIELGGERQRRLLAALLVHRGSTVPTDQLLDAVFDGKRSDAATRTFRTYVSRLRRTLDAHGVDRASVVVTHAAGYATPPDLELDAALFEEGLRTAREHLEDGDSEAALGCVEQALSLWSGAAYGEFSHEEWARPEAMRLEELHIVARELRVAAMVDSGRHVEAIAEVGTIIVREPFREEPRRLLMLAMYRSGRHAEALRAGREFRTLLAEETGLEWSRSLAELETKIITRDPELDATPRGRRVRGYVVGEKLADRPDGVTHRASQPAAGRDVTITVIDADVADDRSFVQRFDAHAQRVASIRHPNVVPLLDHWREPGAAYVVTPYLAGRTLSARLAETAPFDVDSAARLVSEVGAALEAAAERGVHHGCLSPDCVLIDADGRAHVVAFSVVEAPDAARRDVVSYAAIAEALWQRVDVSPASDESAGARVAAASEVAAAALRSPDSTSIGDLCRGLRAAAGARNPQRDDAGSDGRGSDRGPNVYRGLQAFTEPDADVFFGRRTLVDQLVADLCEHRFVALVGPSGSGKSSVIRAGLLPRLRASGAFIAKMVPGRHPIAQFEVALSHVATDRVPNIEPYLERPDGLTALLAAILPGPNPRLIVLIDQLEEAITMSQPDERDALFGGLERAVEGADGTVMVVATARADFLGHLLDHPTIGGLVREHTRLITPLGPEELYEAIVAPAAHAGVTVEPELASLLVADSVDAPGSLPMLQFALTELYEERAGTTLTLEAYHRMGGLGAPIARRAEHIFLSLSDEEREAAHRMFSRLVTPGEASEDTRRRALASELATVPRSLIDLFADARLLTFDRDARTREPTVELAHETLIRQWPRLRSWVDDDRAGLVVLRHLTAAANAWTDSGHEPAELYRGTRLDTAEAWAARHGDELTPNEREYLDASVRARNQERDADQRRERRQRSLTIGLAVLTVVAVVAGVTAVGLRNQADEQRSIARTNELEAERQAAAADVERLTAQAAATLEDDSDLSLLLALEAFERATTVDDDPPPGPLVIAMQRALQSSRIEQRFEGADGAGISPDGDVVIYQSADRARTQTFAVDLGTGAVRPLAFTKPSATSVAFDPSGRRIATLYLDPGSPPSNHVGEVRDARTFEQLGLLATSSCCADLLEFSPDGRLLAGGDRVDGSDATGPVTVWEADRLDAHTLSERAQLIGWLEDGRTVALYDGSSVRFVDAVSGDERRPAMPVDGARSIDVDPAGERLLVVRDDAEIWPIGAATPSESFEHRKGDAALQGRFSNDGARVYLFGEDDELRVISLPSGRAYVLTSNQREIEHISESSDGTRLLATGDGTALLLDMSVEGPEALGNLPTEGRVEDIRIVTGGERALVTEAGLGARANERRIREFDLDRNVAVRSTAATTGTGITASGSGLVALAGRGSSTGRIESFDGPAPDIPLDACDVPIVLDDDARWLLVSNEPDTCPGVPSRVIEPTSGGLLAKLPPNRTVESADFGPSATIAEGLLVMKVAITRDHPRTDDTVTGAIEVRRMPGGALLGTFVEEPLPQYDTEHFLRPRFSSDGRFITFGSASSGGYAIDVARMLDTDQMRDALVPAAPTVPEETTSIEAGGNWLVTLQTDSVLRFHDLVDGREVMQLPVDGVGGAFRITPDGRTLYYADGGIVRRFPLDPDELATIARSRVRRDFTADECERYAIADDCSDYAPAA